MIRACIFDLDGTLANTIESMAVVANGILVDLGLQALPSDNYRYYAGDGAGMLVRRCLRDAGDPQLVHAEQMEEIYREKFNRDPLYKVTAYDGIEDVLKCFRDHGIPTAVCSNKPHEAALQVIGTMFPGLFDVVQGQQEGLRRKPAPDAALRIAERLQVKPEECMYIGDTATDMQTGHAAGMFTVGVLWGFRSREELVQGKAMRIVEHPSELWEVFESENRKEIDRRGTGE